MISKGPANQLACARPIFPFPAARQAFGALLSALEIADGKVLLPAYIGWSPREGSGVFDPIAALRLDYGFYSLDERLRIDLASLQTELANGNVRVLVIIHYFGYVDPAYAKAVEMAKQHDVFVVEDEAHAMLSDIVGGICGRLGDACIYSFHKMLPVSSGGALLFNDPGSPLAARFAGTPACALPSRDFDLHRIAAKRFANSLLLDRLVRELAGEIQPLFGTPRAGEFPQSYPVIIPGDLRDRLYQEMNDAGFGVVSLYHTLISEISSERFSAVAGVSRHILNLPVHQDASESALESMVRKLTASLGRC